MSDFWADAEPVPVPDRVLLPAPDGRDGGDAWWRLSTPDLLFVRDGAVFCAGSVGRSVEDVERDALRVLAACAWARRRTC